MNSNDPSLLDHDAFMMEDPIGYNDAVVGFFKEKYAKHIESIFKKLKNRTDSEVGPWLGESLSSVPKRIVERHLFPVFAAASCSGGIAKHHLAFCSAFIRAISIPLLRIDRRIDRPAIKRIEEQDSICKSQNAQLIECCLFHDGFLDICRLPNGKEIMELVASNYLQVYTSLYYEMMHRYKFDYLSNPKKRLQWTFRSRFSPLTCKYLSTTVQASILLNSKNVSPDIKKLTESFGRLRQLCDQICDVEEDITMGKVTIPVLYALLNDDDKLASVVRTLWSEIQGFGSDLKPSVLSQHAAEIKEITQKLGGFRRAYRLADKWYRQAMSLAHKCNGKPGVGTEVKLLFRLKRAYLERLKCNNWADIPNYY